MITIPVVWYNLHEADGIIARGYWDQAMLENIFALKQWKPVNGYEFTHLDYIPDNFPGAVVVIPARHHANDISRINKDLSVLDWCIVMLTGDEQNVFPVEELEHKRMSIWVMSPNPNRHEHYHKLGSGTPPQMEEYKREFTNKDKDWFFSGQVTNPDRTACVQVLKTLEGGELNETAGFTQGFPGDIYYPKLADAKVAPCPSGPYSPDTFRLFEALELGCVPIAAAKAPSTIYPDRYWENFFGCVPPFPISSDWEVIPHVISQVKQTWPEYNNKVFAFWQNYKRDQVYELHDDIYRFYRREEMTDINDKITVLIPTSPSYLHPSTEMISTTISSIRSRLKTCEIMIMIDGVREEQGDYVERYNAYIRELLWLCNNVWENVLPVLFEEHTHQSSMTKYTLEKVRTPTILFVEHDTPLNGDIDFESIVSVIEDDILDVVRLHHETQIGSYHEHLMLNKEPLSYGNAQFRRTVQWSQRPHVAGTNYYKHILETHFSKNSKAMIEDKMHSVAQVDPWDENRIAVYYHEGNIQHSLNLDGRGPDEKYSQVF